MSLCATLLPPSSFPSVMEINPHPQTPLSPCHSDYKLGKGSVMALKGSAQGEVMSVLPGESFSFPEAPRRVLQRCLQGLPFPVPLLGWESA